MKKLWVFIGIFAILFLALSDNAFSKSSENKAACVSWCNANRPKCVKCYSNTSCGGREYGVIKSFKKGTGNWYACGLSEYGRASQKNKADCEAWCKQDEQCEFCRDKVGCGAGYTSIARYGGQGENWYACGRTEYGQASRKNKAECESWCKQNERCKFCKDKVGCGAGYTSIAKFGGRGENWYACGLTEYRSESQKNKAECEAWCRQHKQDRGCKFCRDKIACGDGYYSIETFGGRGKNWYACGAATLDQCLEWCRTDPRCEYCSSKVSCDFGRLDGQVIKKFLGTTTHGFLGTGDNWYACQLSERGLLTKERLEECNNWCKSSDSCDFCTTRRGECGADVKVVARFRGKGGAVYACKRR